METYLEITKLNAKFAYLVDHHNGDFIPNLFVENGSYGLGERVAEGRSAIKMFFDMRKGRGKRVSRHVFSPPTIIEETERTVKAITMLTLFAEDGDGPHPADILMLADYHDEYVKVDDSWKYKSRAVVPVFGAQPFKNELQKENIG